ncbi:MAG: PRELI domain-containing protein 1, mitochondrial [Paramarteilia canceri]
MVEGSPISPSSVSKFDLSDKIEATIKHPWLNVAQTFFNRYSSSSKRVNRRMDVVNRWVSSDGSLVSLCVFTKEYRTPMFLRSFFQKFEIVYQIEQSVIDPKTETIKIQSRILTSFDKVASYKEQGIYSKDENNKQHTNISKSVVVSIKPQIFPKLFLSTIKKILTKQFTNGIEKHEEIIDLIAETNYSESK